MITKSQLLDAFNFSSAIANERCNNVKDVFSFLSVFKDEYDREKRKLPYHINLISELHADENAHSRILGKLLMQKTHGGKFEILERFIQLIKFNLHIKSPEITQEKERIDLWIRDRDGRYAIIIENKVCGMHDMGHQLARYIKKTIDYGFKEEQIFVIYLSLTDEKKPDEQTWDGYEEKFKDRYVHLSYKEHILPWLRENVLPNVEQKEVYLRSALEQYIDYLEEMLKVRAIDNAMNFKLQEVIKGIWKIHENNPFEALEILEYNKAELEKAAEQINLLKEQCWKNCLSIWVERLDVDFGKDKFKFIEKNETALNLGVESAGAVINLGWWFESKKQQQWCCGIWNEDGFPALVIEKVEHLLNSYSSSPSTWQCRYIALKDTKECYPLLKQVIERLIEK